MKQLLTSVKVLPFLIFYFFYSCNSDSTIKTETILYTNCGIACNNMKIDSSFSISEACANCLTENFAKNGYTFPKTESTDESIRGFQMRNSEIATFFEIIQSDTITDPRVSIDSTFIYGMFGIYHGPNSLGKKITTSHQIFVVEQLGEIENPKDTVPFSIYTHYNFIRPCPNFCPGNEILLVQRESSD